MAVESNDAIAIVSPSDWFKKLAPVFQPVRRKTEANRTLFARFSPRFEQVSRRC